MRPPWSGCRWTAQVSGGERQKSIGRARPGVEETAAAHAQNGVKQVEHLIKKAPGTVKSIDATKAQIQKAMDAKAKELFVAIDQATGAANANVGALLPQWTSSAVTPERLNRGAGYGSDAPSH